MRLPACLIASTLLMAATVAAAPPARPAAPPIVPVVEDLFGTKITDDYRYMETPGDPIFNSWIRSQGKYTRAIFDAVTPRAAAVARLAAFTGGFGAVNTYQRYGDTSLWLERAPGSDNFDLMVRTPAGTRKLVDVAALRAAKGGKPVAINYYAASLDGQRAAVGISEGGSERASLSVFEIADGRRVAGPLAGIQSGPPAWSDDGKRILTNRLAPEKPGASPVDRYLDNTAISWDMSAEPLALFGGGVTMSVIKPDRVQFNIVTAIPGSPVWLALVINGVQNEIELWTAPASAPPTATTSWQRLVTRADEVTRFDVRGDTIYLMSHKGAPTYQLLALKLGQPLSAARVVVPALPGRLLENVKAASDGVYVVAREGLLSRIYRLGSDDKATPVALPAEGSIDADNIFSDPRRPGVVLKFDGWTLPPTFLSYDPARGFEDLKLTKLPAGFRPDTMVATEIEETAKDGVKVPLSVIRPAAAKGPGPLLISAYGSYGVSNFPYFSPRVAAIVAEGISFADCHVRGGGELGETWRLSGKDANKPNTWRDLIACAETAIAMGLTTTKQLFIAGGSAGGIPMGKAMTERPDLFAGVFSMVPMASALRAEFQTNGPANIPEFGTIKDAAGFRNLLAMDGYQSVGDGKTYPPVMITTGLNDPRVDSWQPAKLAARLQAANPKNVVLLRVDEDAGHGVGSTKAQTDALYADMLTFMNWRLGKPGWELKQ